MSLYIVVAVSTCSCACLAGAPVELAAAEVAVGDEGVHAVRLGERQRLAMSRPIPTG